MKKLMGYGLAVWLLAGVALAGESGGAAPGDLKIEATVARSTVSLGEDIEVTVIVTNLDKKAAGIREMRLGRGFLEFKMSVGGGKKREPVKFTYTRINGSVFQPEKPKPVRLDAGKSLSVTVKIPTLLPGKTVLTGILWDKIQLDKLSVRVTGKDQELRWRMQTTEGEMQVRLLPRLAPNTVANMTRLAKDGFFNGIKFHRIMKGFMIQGGNAQASGKPGPGFNLPAEFSNRKHVKGILSMARVPGQNDSGSSQFFVMHAANQGLDNGYTIFGELAGGVDVLDKLANLPVRRNAQGEMSDPIKKPAIKKITVTTAKIEKGN